MKTYHYLTYDNSIETSNIRKHELNETESYQHKKIFIAHETEVSSPCFIVKIDLLKPFNVLNLSLDINNTT